MNWTRYTDAVGRMTETVGADAAPQPGPMKGGYVFPNNPPPAATASPQPGPMKDGYVFPNTPAPSPAPSVVFTDKSSTVATATEWVPAAKIKIEKIADTVKEKVAETPPWQMALGIAGVGIVAVGLFSMLRRS